MKSGVGTATSRESRVWFTLSHGILDEVYYPRVDRACIRDLGFIVTDGHTFFSEEKRNTRSETTHVAPGVPAYVIRTTDVDGRYRIEKEILTDPSRDVVLQRIRFVPLRGTLTDFRLYALLAPHLANRGAGNTAWVGEYKGTPMLLASRENSALALACSAPWLARSAGFVGYSDGWQELQAHRRLMRFYERAENGNVALTGEVDLRASNGQFVLALAFGPTAMEAGQHAVISLMEDFDATKRSYVDAWKAWHRSLEPGASRAGPHRSLYHLSATVLRTHESKRVEGGVIASLSIPWGFSKGDDDLGGYHLIWPRDLVETGAAFVAVGARDEARRVLRYLRVTQEPDGHWRRTCGWTGRRTGTACRWTRRPSRFSWWISPPARACSTRPSGWPIGRWCDVRPRFSSRNGPVSPQDRWEEDPGYAPFTIAVEIAALLAAADLADAVADTSAAVYLRETADAWNAGIERWLYVTGTELASQHDVDGYYVRVAEPDQADAASPRDGFVPIKNRPPDQSSARGSSMVSLDALAFVRFGLRAADDPRMINTLKVIDATLKVDTPRGPAWHRYQGDGYGEHVDGAPFDGTGIGRAWPLLTGERAHYELAAGRRRGGRTAGASARGVRG